jgi:hypothetical protein
MTTDDVTRTTATVFGAAGEQQKRLTAEEASWAAERGNRRPMGWDCVEGWTLAELLEREG